MTGNGRYTAQPDHCHSVSPEYQFVMVHVSDKRIIQQKVDEADIKDAVVIIPTLANVMAYDNLWETGSCLALIPGVDGFRRIQTQYVAVFKRYTQELVQYLV